MFEWNIDYFDEAGFCRQLIFICKTQILYYILDNDKFLSRSRVGNLSFSIWDNNWWPSLLLVNNEPEEHRRYVNLTRHPPDKFENGQ